jgi:hypothetical protein
MEDPADDKTPSTTRDLGQGPRKEPPPEQPPNTVRFEIVRRLGAGGMGVVYEAIDRETGGRVALKTLRSLSSDGLLRFKNELRSARELGHKNVVRLGDLVEEDGQWLFSMELVDGVSFLDYVRPGGQIDVARLRDALAQLVSGVSALHAADKIHRDLKSSNVLVASDGRVVVLDFGLVADRGEGERLGFAVGTPIAMAPEQIRGGQVGPAADWYAVGVMIYMALAGRPPFIGPGDVVCAQKLVAEPTDIATLAPGSPPDLAELTRQLLRIDPARRPDGDELARQVGARGHRGQAAAMVGRAAETAALETALAKTQRESRPIIVLLEGESGVGKSRLARAFADGHSEALVLHGRCHERESVPFKAIDGVVDALSRRVRQLDADERKQLVPDYAEAVAWVFPVLREVPEIAALDLTYVANIDRHALRARLALGLRTLLQRICKLHPLILLIDDLQWADADSLTLLSELLHPPNAPPLLIVATVREARVSVRSIDALAASLPGEVQRLRVGGLPLGEAEALARSLLLARGHTDDIDEAARRIAGEANGHPFFIGELAGGGTATGMRLEDSLGGRLDALAALPRRVVELLSLAGAPLPLGVTAQASGVSVAELVDHIEALRGDRFLAAGGVRPRDPIEPYHDRVRDAALSHIDVSARPALHAALAGALEAAPDRDNEALAVHWLGAGDNVKAAVWAAAAAADAARLIAFDRAARLYRMARDANPSLIVDGEPVRLRFADALAAAGRGAEAGDAFLAAVEDVAPERRLDLEQRAAEQYLRAGHVDTGLVVLRRVLDAAGMSLPATPGRALSSFLYRRMLLTLRGKSFRARDGELDRLERKRIDICSSVAIVLGNVDTVRGADYQARGLLLSLRSGDRYCAARALAVEGAYSALGGEPAAKRTEAIFARAAALADEIDNLHARALVIGASGLAAFLEGRYKDGERLCAEAAVIFEERCPGVLGELAHAQLYRLLCLAFLGDVAELRRLGRMFARSAAERGDLYLATNVRTRIAHVVHLADDNPAAARVEIDEAMAAWTQTGCHLQHFFELVSRTQTDLYDGNARAALDRAVETAPKLHKAFLTRISDARMEIEHTVARSAVAVAVDSKEPRLLSLATKYATGLVKRKPTRAAESLGLGTLAAVAALRGQRDEALALLERTEKSATAADTAAQAQSARWLRGRWLADDNLVAEAERWMTAQGIRIPERFVRMMVPGPLTL